MREVAIIGIGQTKIEEHWEKDIRILAGEAIINAMNDAQRDAADGLYVGNMLSGAASHQQHLGTMIADWVGLRFSEAFKIESACSSGSAAFRCGLMAIASGAMDCVIVAGVEKMTDSPGGEITSSLATAADADWEIDQGASFVTLNALLMRRYMHEYGWKHADFAPISINAHANAVHNPYARFQSAIREEDYLKAPMICEPINLMDASSIGDGAAAIVLVPAESLNTFNQPLIKVVASASSTDTISLHHRSCPVKLQAAETSSQSAYMQAGITPAEIDLFELHDAFSIMAALSLEACGFADQGQAPRLGLEGCIRPDGTIPIATRGGLKARGHPVGATGIYQLLEVVQQLRRNAGETQVPGARYGMAQNIGGSGSNVVTHILKRE